MYLLKSGAAVSITHASSLLGYSRKTVQRWLSQYQREGLQGLLAIRHGGGRPAGISLWAQTKLKARLAQPRGFGEIVTWLASQCAVRVNYWVVYHGFRQRWKAKLKTPRPSHAQQDPQAVTAFPERLSWKLRSAVRIAPDWHIRYWVEDESRFGLKPICRRRITAHGVPPIALPQWRFEWVWLYGFVEPLTGESFFWEYSRLDHQCFGEVLAAFTREYSNPDEMHIIQLDQSAVHRATDLEIPPNVAFYFYPPYSPELNPIEQLWALLKGRLSNRLWFDLYELKQALSHQLIPIL
ncbi:MAG: IS630 family transposase [Leptolyngbya sp. SIO1D8]|nr:IS630 family transposase [Leptolyngbya sp. SIO1D8]